MLLRMQEQMCIPQMTEDRDFQRALSNGAHGLEVAWQLLALPWRVGFTVLGSD